MIIQGYAAIFNIRDKGADVIRRGAFAKSLKGRKPGDVRLLWQHQQDNIVGKVTEIYEDQKGLKFKAELLDGFWRAPDARAGVESGVVSMSIGYRTKEAESEVIEGETVRVIKEAHLAEVSVVTLPMNDHCEVWRAPISQTVSQKALAAELEATRALFDTLNQAAARLASAAL